MHLMYQFCNSIINTKHTHDLVIFTKINIA